MHRRVDLFQVLLESVRRESGFGKASECRDPQEELGTWLEARSHFAVWWHEALL